jgi:amino-acid N-acetyltransferase
MPVNLQPFFYGRSLNTQIENFAKDSGINCMYLITTTAKDFFERQGYCVIKRETAPGSITQTSQFSGLCPSTATVMKKRI